MNVQEQKVRAFRNGIALIITRLLEPLTNFGLVIFVARHLGAEILGIYASALAMLFIFLPLANLGLQNFVVREVAADGERAADLIRALTRIILLSSLVAASSMAGLARLLEYESHVVQAYDIGALCLIVSAQVTVYGSTLMAREKMYMLGAATIAGNLFKVVASVLLIAWGNGIRGLMIAFLLGQFVMLIIQFACVRSRSESPASKAMIRHNVKKILRAVPVFISICFSASLRRGMGVVILSRISGLEEAGIYGAAFKLYVFWFFLPQCLASAVFPQFAYSFQNDRAYFDLISEKALRFVLVIILPVVGGTVVLADRIVLLIFGPEFQAAADVLRILAIGLVPYSSSVIFARRFIATKNQMADLRTNVTALVVVAIFLTILTPRFGAQGAAVSVCIATFVFLLHQLSFMRASHLKMRVIKPFLAPAVCASIMAGCTWLLRSQSLAIAIGLSAMIYFGSSIICGSIRLRWFDMILHRQFRLDRYK